jgi:thiol:disulfide interchange protein
MIFLLMAGVLGISQWLGPRERVPWGNDLSAAMTQAKGTHKPVLAYFTAGWCGPCQNMKRNVWSDQKVADAAKAYVPVRIDIDLWPELKQKYNVVSIPLVAVMDDQGNVLRSLTGMQEPADMIAWLAQAN